MSVAMTVWAIGYLFTLGAIPDDPNSSFWKDMAKMLSLTVVWPLILGIVWRHHK